MSSLHEMFQLLRQSGRSGDSDENILFTGFSKSDPYCGTLACISFMSIPNRSWKRLKLNITDPAQTTPSWRITRSSQTRRDASSIGHSEKSPTLYCMCQSQADTVTVVSGPNLAEPSHAAETAETQKCWGYLLGKYSSSISNTSAWAPAEEGVWSRYFSLSGDAKVSSFLWRCWLPAAPRSKNSFSVLSGGSLCEHMCLDILRPLQQMWFPKFLRFYCALGLKLEAFKEEPLVLREPVEVWPQAALRGHRLRQALALELTTGDKLDKSAQLCATLASLSWPLLLFFFLSSPAAEPGES